MDEYDTDTGYWDVEINPQGEYVNVFHPYSALELALLAGLREAEAEMERLDKRIAELEELEVRRRYRTGCFAEETR